MTTHAVAHAYAHAQHYTIVCACGRTVREHTEGMAWAVYRTHQSVGGPA